MTSLDDREEWVRWWCSAWQWAHTDWKVQFAATSGLTPDDFEALMRSRHGDFLRSVGIVPSQPPEPCEHLMHWLALSPIQRERALSLARRICFAPLDLSPRTDDFDTLWCQRLAKALRPGLWLDPLVTDVRPLLGAWLGQACWLRLRLMWPPAEVAESFGDMPDNKLQTLWQAILWRVAAP
ncbi:hypothetical protein ABH912_005430 [Pseudomonas sp. BT76 TE3572]|uniref:Type III secretion protein n=1 Tax=Pseudomonas mandelii PD30 TaxID=1419583 RepID=A0A059KVZ5_9PSED|nr:type III secretion protein [Pseudomonas mandelii PD30]